MGHRYACIMNWGVLTPYIVSILALMGSVAAVAEARKARRETAKIDLARETLTRLEDRATVI